MYLIFGDSGTPLFLRLPGTIQSKLVEPSLVSLNEETLNDTLRSITGDITNSQMPYNFASNYHALVMHPSLIIMHHVKAKNYIVYLYGSIIILKY